MKFYDPALEQTKQPADNVPESPESNEPKPFFYRSKNWWYYHKWYVIGGIALLLFLGNIIGNALGLWEKKPDFQIAYVGSVNLPDDTVDALEQAFAELAGDFNQDGEAIVQINQYIMNSDAANPEAASYNYSSEVVLMGDLSTGESYFFLTENPEYLQKTFQIFANPDGSCPDEDDISVEDKTVLWADCGALTAMNLGSYTVSAAGAEISGDNQELLSGLYLGRRYFYTDKTVDCLNQCDALWNTIVSTKDMQKQ